MKTKLPKFATFIFFIVFSLIAINKNILAQTEDPNKSIKLGTMEVPTATPQPTVPFRSPTPTIPPQATPTFPPPETPQPTIPGATQIPGAPIPTTQLIRGGPVQPDDPYYCIDDSDPDSCDDNTAYWVPKGTGGNLGTCGTVIEQGHKLVNSLPHFDKGIRDSLNPAVSNCGYTTGPYSAGQYISTYFPIDAYNLAGISGLSKTDHSQVLASNLLTWWQSAAAQSAGYTYVPYTPTAIENHAKGIRDLTGCIMFLNLPGGVHVGMVNKLELLTSNGDGVISILQSGVRFYIDRFIVEGWNILNTPQHQTELQSVAGFGCH